jgi:hypothetical protein
MHPYKQVACHRRIETTPFALGSTIARISPKDCPRSFQHSQLGSNQNGHAKATAQMEQDLAEDLRRAGYPVMGGH